MKQKIKKNCSSSILKPVATGYAILSVISAVSGVLAITLTHCLCQTVNFDWWKNVVSEMQEFENKKFCLEQKYGCDAVWHAIGDNMLCDIEFQASNGMDALRSAFPDEFSEI